MRIDAETAGAAVRACEPDASGLCGTVLFEGTVALGESEPVCTEAETLVYQEYDEQIGGFAAPVEAVCEGGDVEI